MKTKKWIKIILQIIAISLFYEGIRWVVGLLEIPFPPNVLGMVILFFLLVTGIIPISWISDGSDFLLKYMPILFVPFGVAMMNYWNTIKSSGIPLFLVLTMSSFLVAAATGYCARYWQQRKNKEENSEVSAYADHI